MDEDFSDLFFGHPEVKRDGIVARCQTGARDQFAESCRSIAMNAGRLCSIFCKVKSRSVPLLKLPVIRRAGETIPEFGPMSHWWKNTRSAYVIILAADVVEVQKAVESECKTSV